MNLRCRLGFHKWTYALVELKEGSIRICIRCGREEMYVCGIDKECKWYECLQGEMIDV